MVTGLVVRSRVSYTRLQVSSVPVLLLLLFSSSLLLKFFALALNWNTNISNKKNNLTLFFVVVVVDVPSGFNIQRSLVKKKEEKKFQSICLSAIT